MINNAPVRPAAGATIPHFDLGGTGMLLHFLHANGYPPACYSALLERLKSQYHVFGMLLRALWPEAEPQAIRDWHPFSEDLRQFLQDQNTGAMIGMGHSIGAIVTLRAALRQPELFRALILLDPVLFPRRRMLQLRIVQALGLADRVNPWIEGARRRRRHFDDLNQLFNGYRRRDIFRYFSDEHLRALIEGMTRRNADGSYELAYSPEWEARIYETGISKDWDLWSGLKELKVPTLIIRGAETDTFRENTARIVQRTNPNIQVVSLPASTHLLPMEKPEEVFELSQDFLAGLHMQSAV